MKEVLLRLAAPATVICVEVEAPLRVFSVARGRGDLERLGLWFRENPERLTLLALALAEAGDRERGDAWSDALRGDGDGVVGALERALGL